MHIYFTVTVFYQLKKIINVNKTSEIVHSYNNYADSISCKMLMKTIDRTSVLIISIYEIPCNTISCNKNPSCKMF